VLLDIWANRRVIYTLYLRAARDALRRQVAEQFGIKLGLAAFLHTWNQWMLMHLHIHTIWPNGGWLIDQPQRFVTVDARQLDKERLMKAFRDALLGRLWRAAERGLLVFGGAAAFLESDVAFGDWIQQLKSRRWVLLPQDPLEGGEAALGYLARYTRRVAIDNRRILEFDPARGIVTFGYRANNAGPNGEDIKDTRTIPAVEFIRRYLEHVMPKGLGRTQFYGWWSSSRKGKELPRIRAQLGVELAPDEASEEAKKPDGDVGEEDAAPRRPCPACKERTLVRLWLDPIPRLYDLMRIVIWPQQRKQPLEHQVLLPELEAWLPGGDQYLASVRARLDTRPASGFT